MILKPFSLALAIAAAVSVAIQGRPASAENIVFPKDSGVINVKQAPYNAYGDGVHDDTAAIQKALTDFPNAKRIIYLPNGTYLVSRTLAWPLGDKVWGFVNLQGQSKAGTIIRLKDATFTEATHPQAVILTGVAGSADRFANSIQNLTVDTGRNNTGAEGVRFFTNNQGCMRRVTIRSEDHQGVIGLDLAYNDMNGPLLVKNVEVEGFDTGIAAGHSVNSQTFEHLVLRGQRRYGFANDGQCISIHDLFSDNAVPALYNGSGTSFLTLLGATLKGRAGASRAAAIINAAALCASGVHTSGYSQAIAGTMGDQKSVIGPDVAAFVSHPVLSLFPSPPHMLGLPVKETPDVPWENPNTWASVVKFGADPTGKKPSTAAVQAAIDSGATTVYFPFGTYNTDDTIYIRANVRRIIGCGATVIVKEMGDKPGFDLVEGKSPIVIFERIWGGYNQPLYLKDSSRRTLVVSSCCFSGFQGTGTGDIFFDDVCAAPFRFAHERVWARQLNPENQGTHILNSGGALWILGLKTERGGTLIDTEGGGRTELVGGFCYTTTDPQGAPMFVNNNSSVSLSMGESNYGAKPYTTLVRETRAGATKTLLAPDAPKRAGGSMMPLYVGFPR